MTRITISGQTVTAAGNAATVRFDGGPAHDITLSLPFSEAEDADLEWYFEQHLKFPFSEADKLRAQGRREYRDV